MQDIVLIVIALCVLTILVGLLRSKALFTRILFLNSLTNLAVLLIVALGSYQYNESYLDIAIIYTALSFVTMAAILKFTLAYKNH